MSITSIVNKNYLLQFKNTIAMVSSDIRPSSSQPACSTMLKTASQWKHKQQANLTFIPFIPIWDLVFNICRNWTRKMIAKPCRVSVWCVHSYLHPERQSLPWKGACWDRRVGGGTATSQWLSLAVVSVWGGGAGSQAAFPPAQSIPSQVTMAVFTFRRAKRLSYS